MKQAWKMHFSWSGIGIYWSLEEYFLRKKNPKPLIICVSNIKITGSLEELSIVN